MKRKRPRKRDIKKILRELSFEKAPLSNNKGRLIRTDHCPNKVNSKERRHRGWVTARFAGPGKYSEAFAEGNEPLIFYDAWQDGRDGLRYNGDKTHIRNEYMSGWAKCRNCNPGCRLYANCLAKDNPVLELNEKLRRFAKIRQARKEKQRKKSLG